MEFHGALKHVKSSYLTAVFLNLFTYVAQITFGKNCVAHYLVSIGYAFIRVNKCTLF